MCEYQNLKKTETEYLRLKIKPELKKSKPTQLYKYLLL